MSKLKKILVWVFSILLLILLIVFIVYVIQNTREQKIAREQAKILETYKRLVPNSIKSYPEITSYYNNQLKKGLIDPNYQLKGGDPIRERLSELMPSDGKIDDIRMWCEDLTSFPYQDHEELLLSWLNEEIDINDYQTISKIEARSSVPTLDYYLSEYAKDKKITYKEYCSLPYIYNLSTHYERALQKQLKKQHILNN